jgi:hypothetical protein
MTLMTFLLIVIFLLGLYFYVKQSSISEGFSNGSHKRCPDLLIQKGARFYLYNSKVAQVPGVNPIEFDTLEDYTEFLEWQRSQNIRCPVLYLQETYDAQGNRVYKARPSVSEPQYGLPPSTLAPIGIASQVPPLMESALDQVGDPAYPNPTMLTDATRDDPPYNTGSYPGYDPTDFYVGTTTPLDAMNIAKSTAPISDNPMDPNWGGAEYSQALIDQGYYKGNEVAIKVP